MGILPMDVETALYTEAEKLEKMFPEAIWRMNSSCYRGGAVAEDKACCLRCQTLPTRAMTDRYLVLSPGLSTLEELSPGSGTHLGQAGW